MASTLNTFLGIDGNVYLSNVYVEDSIVFVN